MTTSIRPTISKHNKYYISKHRYYELKHFCLQYHEWKQEYLGLSGESCSSLLNMNSDVISDPTEKAAERRLYFRDKIDLIEKAAKESDEFLAGYILKAVTEGLSYVNLRMKYDIPCGRDYFYSCYRRFFWILNNSRK